SRTAHAVACREAVPSFQGLPRERARPNAMASTKPPLFRISDHRTSLVFAKSSGLSPSPSQAARRDTAAICGSASEIFAGLTGGLATAVARAFTAVLSSASLWRQRGPLVEHSASRDDLVTERASLAAAITSDLWSWVAVAMVRVAARVAAVSARFF